MKKSLRQLISETYKTARVVGRGTVKIDPSEVSSTEEFKQAKKKARDIVEENQRVRKQIVVWDNGKGIQLMKQGR